MKSQKVDFLQRNMEAFFRDLVDRVVEKVDLLNNLEDEVKSLSTTEDDALKGRICRVEDTNSQLTNEVVNLQDFVDELHAAVVYLQENDDRSFDEYQALKEAHDFLLLQLTEKDETIQGLLVCKQDIKEKFFQLQNVEMKTVELPNSPIEYWL